MDREKREPSPGPGGLAAYDPDGFRLLASIYGGTHPQLSEADPKAKQLKPLAVRKAARADPSADLSADPRSVDDPEKESDVVSMEFDNTGCGCSWKLWWIDAHGEPFQYGTVQGGQLFVQQTFPGHVWKLHREASATAAADAETLHYAAAPGACVALVADDAGCRRIEARPEAAEAARS